LIFLVGCGDAVSFPAIPQADGLPPLGDRVGIAGPIGWGTDPRGQTIAKLQSMHITHLRTDFWWHRLETTAGQFDFSALDPMVDDTAAAGIQVLPILDYGNGLYPSGASSTDDPTFFPVTDPSHFANYVAAVLGHYRDRIGIYELWNEENIGYRFWKPNADPAAYAANVRYAVALGRGACAGCAFVMGGVSMPQPVPMIDLFPPGPSYLRMLPPDVFPLVDAVAFHPYQYPKDPPEVETAPFPTRKQGSLATQYRAILEFKPGTLWITEEGWPTNPDIPQTDDEITAAFGLPQNIIEFGRQLLGPNDFQKVLETLRGVSEADQARYLVRATLIALSLQAARIYLYTLDDSLDTTGGKNQEASFGLYRADGSEKPAAGALRNLLSRYGDYAFAGDVAAAMGLASSDHALAFRKGNQVAIALWRYPGEESIEISGVPANTVLVDGNGNVLARASDSLSVKLSGDVVWLETTR
jgi:hypothetical protein